MQTDLYTAFLRAADRIENNPSCFRWTETRIPHDSEDVGCVLGWVACEMEIGLGGHHADTVLGLLALPHFGDFSVWLRELDGNADGHGLRGDDGLSPAARFWITPKRVAAATRQYAETYLKPAQEPALPKLLKSLDTAPIMQPETN